MPQAIRTGSHNTNNGINTINRRQEELGAQKKKKTLLRRRAILMMPFSCRSLNYVCSKLTKKEKPYKTEFEKIFRTIAWALCGSDKRLLLASSGAQKLYSSI